MNPTPTTGTTLAVLQAYPLGTLEVQVSPYGTSRHYRRLLVGLNQELRAAGGWTAETVAPDGLKSEDVEELMLALERTNHSITEVLPVLRPFSQLCEPLEDGIVPALVLADILYADRTGGNKQNEYIAKMRTNGSIVITRGITHEMGVLYPWWLKQGDMPVKAADYLRRNHFALPVNGRPLIEGVDYIAKALAAPLAIQEGKSDE